MLTAPPTIVAASTARTAARARFTAATIRRRSKRSAIAPAGQAEEQVRELLGEQRHRDEERVVRQRRDEQRAGGQRDAVADVRDERRGQQPAEAAAESTGRDGLGDAGRYEGHRAEDSNARRREAPIPARRLWTGR